MSTLLAGEVDDDERGVVERTEDFDVHEGIFGRVHANLVGAEALGGIAWMVNGNMACGIIGDDLMVRLDRDEAEAAQAEEHVGPMDFTGRPMRGFVMVEAAGIDDDANLGRWVDAGADFAESLPPK